MLDNNPIHPIFNDAPNTLEFRKLRKRIIRKTKEALDTFSMVERDCKWLVCLSGGKDSYTLLAALIELKWRGVFPMEILVCNLGQGQPNFPSKILPDFLKKNNPTEHSPGMLQTAFVHYTCILVMSPTQHSTYTIKAHHDDIDTI